MNIYAISDIHGNIDPLISLLDTLPLKPQDLLIFLGDYVDRGPDSKGVIDYLIYLKKELNCITLKGNHEQLMQHGLTNHLHKQLWKINGGNKTIKSYKGELRNIPQSHKQFLHSCKLSYETEDYFFSHAGCDPSKPMNEQTEDDLIWTYKDFQLAPKLPTDKMVIYGHVTPQDRLGSHNGIDRYCVDNGCYLNRPLMALRLPDYQIFHSAITGVS